MYFWLLMASCNNYIIIVIPSISNILPPPSPPFPPPSCDDSRAGQWLEPVLTLIGATQVTDSLVGHHQISSYVCWLLTVYSLTVLL